jgi:hypothetical protein
MNAWLPGLDGLSFDKRHHPLLQMYQTAASIVPGLIR